MLTKLILQFIDTLNGFDPANTAGTFVNSRNIVFGADILGDPALGYSVALLYTGVPIMMDVNKEKGFLFSSAILAFGLVALVGLIVVTVSLWGFGIGPSFRT